MQPLPLKFLKIFTFAKKVSFPADLLWKNENRRTGRRQACIFHFQKTPCLSFVKCGGSSSPPGLSRWRVLRRRTVHFILHRAILLILIMRYSRKVKLVFIVSTISRWSIEASATQCSTGALLRTLRHGGSQPRIEEGTSHHARRGKNAEAFLILC